MEASRFGESQNTCYRFPVRLVVKRKCLSHPSCWPYAPVRLLRFGSLFLFCPVSCSPFPPFPPPSPLYMGEGNPFPDSVLLLGRIPPIELPPDSPPGGLPVVSKRRCRPVRSIIRHPPPLSPTRHYYADKLTNLD